MNDRPEQPKLTKEAERPPMVVGRRASECLAYLRGRSPVVLDDRFGEDLLDILAGEPVEERPSWDF